MMLRTTVSDLRRGDTVQVTKRDGSTVTGVLTAAGSKVLRLRTAGGALGGPGGQTWVEVPRILVARLDRIVEVA